MYSETQIRLMHHEIACHTMTGTPDVYSIFASHYTDEADLPFCFSFDVLVGFHGLPDAHSNPRSGALIIHSNASHTSCDIMPTGQQQHFNGSSTIHTTTPTTEMIASNGRAIMTNNHRQHAVSVVPSWPVAEVDSSAGGWPSWLAINCFEPTMLAPGCCGAKLAEPPPKLLWA